MSRIGRAIIELTLKGHQQTKAQLADTKKDLDSLKGGGAGGGSKFDDLLKDMAKAKADVAALGAASTQAGSISALSWVSAAASLAVYAAAAVAAGIAISRGFDLVINRAEDSQNRMDQLVQSMRDKGQAIAASASPFGPKDKAQREAAETGAAVVAEFAKAAKTAQDKIGVVGSSARWFGSLFGLAESDPQIFARVERDANRLADVARNARKNIRDEEARENAAKVEADRVKQQDASEKRSESDRRATARMNADKLQGFEKIQAAQDEADRELSDRAKNTTNSDELDAIAARKEASDALFDEQRMKWAQEQNERDQREQERDERDTQRKLENAKRVADAYARYMDAAADRFAAKLNASVTAAMNQQANASNQSLDKLAATVGSIQSIIQARLRASGVVMSKGG